MGHQIMTLSSDSYHLETFLGIFLGMAMYYYENCGIWSSSTCTSPLSLKLYVHNIYIYILYYIYIHIQFRWHFVSVWWLFYTINSYLPFPADLYYVPSGCDFLWGRVGATGMIFNISVCLGTSKSICVKKTDFTNRWWLVQCGAPER